MPERQQRLLKLIQQSGAILGSPRPETVLPGILSLAREFVAADGFAVWRFDPLAGRWAIAAHEGVSAGFAEAFVPVVSADEAPIAQQPIAAEDVMELPLLKARRQAYAAEGIRSMLAIPLVAEDASATLVFYFRDRHAFTPAEIETAQAVGSLAGAALRTAERYGEQRAREKQALFLARAAAALGGSLDHLETLKTVARLAVPEIADWCAVDMVGADGTIERLAVTHVDPARERLAEEFARKYPPDPNAATGLPAVLRTGRPEILGQLTDEMIAAGTEDPAHREAVRALRITSYMMVPLRTRRGVVGAITFVSAESGRQYTEADLRFAETVADRAAAAIENAWAYEETRTANQLKDQFLATLSHELRTPLNAIAGYAQMLRGGKVPEARRGQALDVIERNAAVLTQIVEDLLDVSRIISGKLRLKSQRVPIADVARDAVRTMLPTADSKGVQLVSNIAVNGVFVDGDADRLQQVLWNLLANAVKFTPSQGRVALEMTASDGGVEVAVSDTGQGIDPAFLPHLFEPFRQADSSTSREKSGLGLGLSIARQIVEMHGGSIEASSEGIGRGATFRVRLPAARTAT